MSSHSNVRSSPALPLLVWLVAQLIALALSAARVPLWAGFGSVGERHALAELIVAQFLASSLLFPFLCRSAQITAVLWLASLPMLALAAYLSWTSTGQCGACALNLAIWLAALDRWEKVATGRGQLPAVALISTLNIGGVVLGYFCAETHGTFPHWADAIPLISAIHLEKGMSFTSLVPAGLILLLGVVAGRLLPASFSTAVIH